MEEDTGEVYVQKEVEEVASPASTMAITGRTVSQEKKVPANRKRDGIQCYIEYCIYVQYVH